MSGSISAQSRVEEYMRAESRLSSVHKPDAEEGESKATYCWRLIRQSVRQATEVLRQADARDLTVVHGIHHNRKLRHPHPVQEMIYNRNTKEYVSLDGKMIRVFQSDGRKKDVLTPPEPFTKLIHAVQVNLYVGWIPGDDRLFLLNDEFELQSVSKGPGPVHCGTYNDHTGEVLTLGADYITNWVFRYGGRHILPRRTSHDGFKPDDQFEIMVLEETASRSQKMFCAVGTSVLVFNVYDGKLLMRKSEAHVRRISAMLHFNPLKYLITAAKDGSIKVWDEKWHLQLVFVGHGGLVRSLAVYPYGPNIVSCSDDHTIRIWSLETCDQVDEIRIDEPVRNISTLLNHDSFCSYGDSGADLWSVKHVHHLHTRISHRVHQMKTTDHPEFPIRNLVLCRDASVRIMSPTTGDIITTLLMNPQSRLVDAAYAIAEETLFAVFANGTIVKSASCTNPCTVLDEWECSNPKKACNYLLVYEYVITASIGSDTWGGIKRAMEAGGLSTPQSDRKSKNVNRTLLLGGRKDGHICVFNWDTGDVEFEIEAHGSKGVLSMIANSKADQLISAGLDNIIKIWRLYPYAQESLAPLMSFFCAHTPVHMTVLKTSLVVAFQEPTTATYSTVMYNLYTKDRHDHSPEDDHMDNMTGLAACNKMKILASSSTDGTVRIWNDSNVLIRIIKLSATPHSLSFCSDKGDILVGIGDHVHKIDYKNYMPSSYRLKIVSMQFRHQKEEKSLPVDEDLLSALSREDVKRLKAARSSFKFTHFVDILTEDENDEVLREKRLREKAFAELDARDNELTKIRDGDLPATKKPKSTPVTKREAFDKYLSIFYNRTKITLPEEDPFPKDSVKEILEGPIRTETGGDFTSEKEPTGFFPPASAARPVSVPTPPPLPPGGSLQPRTPATPIRPDGYVPNSVLTRLLWPKESLEAEARKKEEVYRPPQLSDAQMSQIASIQKKKQKMRVKIQSLGGKMALVKRGTQQGFDAGSFRDRTLVLDYDDEESKRDAEEEEEKMKSAMSSKEPSSFLSKVKDIMSKAPSPEPTPEPPSRSVTQGGSTGPLSRDQTVTDEDLPASARASQPKRIVLKPKVPNKFLARPLPPPVSRTTPEGSGMSSGRPAQARTPTPSPPPTPLPSFITQFKGTEWFDKYFPNCNENTMPKPWSAQAFAVMLARLLRITEYPQKIDVAEAILAIHESDGLKEPEPISAAIYSVLHHGINAPTCSDPHQKAFLKVALQLLHALGLNDKAFYRELLVQFLEGDREMRNLIQDLLCSSGLKDPHNYLVKELDGWDVWNIEEKNRSTELAKICDDWLEKWMSSFKIHIKDSIERLKKGQNIRGRATPSQLRNQQRSILKKPAPGGIAEEDEARSEGQTNVDESDSKSITVTFNKAPDTETLDGATYMEAINYFCEMELEKYLDRIRGGDGAATATKSDAHKNTVLVLPKIMGKPTLVRLGETHTSKCRPQRETALAADLRLPPITARGRPPGPGQMYGFPSCINLPMKSVVMNPFPSEIDDYEERHQPILLMLKTAQKYFIPARSYLEQDVPPT